MIYVTFYNLINKIVTSSRDFESIDDVVPLAGEGFVETPGLVAVPSYYKSGAILTIPPAPGAGLVWNGNTESWVYDFPLMLSGHRERVDVLTTFYYEFGFSYTAPGATDAWTVRPNTWIANRINAMVQTLMLSPPGALPMKVFGSPFTEAFQPNRRLIEQVVTREEAQSFCLLYSLHVEKVARQRQYQLTQARKAEILYATDPVLAQQNLIDLIDAGWIIDPPLFT